MAASLISCRPLEKSPGNLTEQTEEAENDDPVAAAWYEFNMTKDPVTGIIPAGFREKELRQVRESYARQIREAKNASNVYTLVGPTNLGGRTRSVVYDVRYNGTTNRCMLAGSVSGWIFKSTDDGNNWVRKTTSASTLNVSSIVQDPRPGHQDTWYYGTGEAFGMPVQALPQPNGDGVFKSDNNGESWTRLPASNTGVPEYYDRREDVVWRLAVDPLNGDVYMAACGAIFLSCDGGSTWNTVLAGLTEHTQYQSTDIAVTSTGRFYAAFGGYNGSDIDGIWTSLSGSPGTWTRIAGEGAGGAPVGWESEGNYGRIVLAIAPSNENTVYTFAEALQPRCNKNRVRLHRWDMSTEVWTDLTNNLPGCGSGLPNIQTYSGYAMAITVKPDNQDVVFIGGVDLYRSTDGFSSPNKITYTAGSVVPGTGIHVDIHAFAFRPGQPNVLTSANDGGMQQTANAQDIVPYWSQLNNNYVTYQFYFVTLDPRFGSNKVMGGAQDNGTVRNVNGEGSQFEGIYSGDGVSVGLSTPINGQSYEYAGYQYGNIYRRNVAWGLFNTYDIRPASAPRGGSFVTIFHLDPDNTEYLYHNADGHLYRNTAASEATPYNWTEMTGYQFYTPPGGFADIHCLSTTRGTYKNEKSSLYIASFGGVYRLDDPVHASPATVPFDISGQVVNGSPAEWFGWISSISVNPRNDDTVMVTFSTVNTVGIFWTGNAKSAHPSWVNVERNLTLPSIRSSAIAVTAEGVEYFVGTSAGLFHSSNPLTMNWNQEAAEEIGNVLVSDLFLRPSDNRLLVGTHGNGMWMTTLSSSSLPITLQDFSAQLQNGHVLLQWLTSSEINASGFEVQRSYDGVNFNKIGFVPSSRNGNANRHYYYSDPEPAVEKNYYRLNLIDLDGKTKLSSVILVRQEHLPQAVTVSNPFNNQINIKFARLPQGSVKMVLYDMMGRKVSSFQTSAVTRPIFQFGDVERLPPGTYVLRLETEGKTFRFKLIRQ